MKRLHQVLAGSLPCLFFAQPSFAANWTGSATCDITVTGPGGYSDTQTHQWVMTGAAPTHSGAFDYYPATWSATGRGSFERSQGSQTLSGQWERSVAGMSAPIAMVVRASDGAILINAGHTQLRAPGAVQGNQEVKLNGKTTSHAIISLEAFEYTFPASQGAANATHVSGTKSESPVGSFGPMQPGGSKVEVKCSWDFQRGGPAGAPVSSSSASSATTVESGGAHPGIVPAGSSTPTPAPASAGASDNQAIQAPGTAGNYQTPAKAISPSTDCTQALSDIDAQYDSMEQAIERQYAALKQQSDAERAQLQAQINALNVAQKRAPDPLIDRQIHDLKQRIAELSAEQAKNDAEKNKALAEIQKNKESAVKSAQRQCQSSSP